MPTLFTYTLERDCVGLRETSRASYEFSYSAYVVGHTHGLGNAYIYVNPPDSLIGSRERLTQFVVEVNAESREQADALVAELERQAPLVPPFPQGLDDKMLPIIPTGAEG